jgi:hypothetical protein
MNLIARMLATRTTEFNTPTELWIHFYFCLVKRGRKIDTTATILKVDLPHTEPLRGDPPSGSSSPWNCSPTEVQVKIDLSMKEVKCFIVK